MGEGIDGSDLLNLGIDMESEFYKKRYDNLARVCELVYEDYEKMIKDIVQTFYRNINDYYLLQRVNLPTDEDVIQSAYIETLAYIGKTHEDRQKK